MSIKQTLDYDPFIEMDHVVGHDDQLFSIPDGERIYKNSLYQVHVRVLDAESPMFWHLSIKRLDRASGISWRHKQWIKNDLCGEETTAMEVFPPESKLVDTANQYHLWVFDDPNCLPFIWQTRFVAESSIRGAVQDAWPDSRRPVDLLPEGVLTDMASDIRKELGYKDLENTEE